MWERVCDGCVINNLVCRCFDQWEQHSGLSLQWIRWSNFLCKVYQSRCWHSPLWVLVCKWKSLNNYVMSSSPRSSRNGMSTLSSVYNTILKSGIQNEEKWQQQTHSVHLISYIRNYACIIWAMTHVMCLQFSWSLNTSMSFNRLHVLFRILRGICLSTFSHDDELAGH